MFRWLKRRPEPDPRMRIIGYREVAPHVVEVTTESEKYGQVVRRVLVLPEWAFEDRPTEAKEAQPQ